MVIVTYSIKSWYFFELFVRLKEAVLTEYYHRKLLIHEKCTGKYMSSFSELSIKDCNYKNSMFLRLNIFIVMNSFRFVERIPPLSGTEVLTEILRKTV